MITRVLAFLCLFFTISAARAHGQFPAALDLRERPDVPLGDPRRILVEANFGLIERDAEGRWRLLCDDVPAQGLKWFVPGPGSSLSIASAQGVLSSRDGCVFETLASLERPVRGIATALLDQRSRVWLIDADGRLLRSDDSGASFGLLDDGSARRWTSIRARDADHVAATAIDPASRTWVLESLDGGATWASARFDPEGQWAVLDVGAAGVFVKRTQGAAHELWQRPAGASGFDRVLTLKRPPLFVTAVSAQTVWTGAGGADTFRSDDGGLSWSRQSQWGDLGCLRWIDGALYGCVVDLSSHLAVARSDDGGATVRPWMLFSEVLGLTRCPAGSTAAAACEPSWPVVAAAMGVVDRASDAAPALSSNDTDPVPASPSGCASTMGVPAWVILAAGSGRRRRSS